jgi:hypothetical protein
MFSGILRRLPAAMAAALVIAAATMTPCQTATADPDQDQKFFDLLGQKDIPPVDNANSLIATARKVCAKLDDGMPVGDLVERIRNNGFNDNPLARLQPQDRITRTIDQFINASVEAYCPYDRGKIASIAAYRGRGEVVHRQLTLTALVLPNPAGEIAPTKPLPVPAQPPPVPQEIQPQPQQPPPPPQRRVQPAPAQPPPQQAEPPQPEAPAPRPEAPAAPVPGSGGDGGATPASPTPDQPTPPGHIRLAP